MNRADEPLLDCSRFGLPDPARLLDPARVRDRLAGGLLAGAARLEVRPTYLRLKPATSLLVLYRVTAELPQDQRLFHLATVGQAEDLVVGLDPCAAEART